MNKQEIKTTVEVMLIALLTSFVLFTDTGSEFALDVADTFFESLFSLVQ